MKNRLILKFILALINKLCKENKLECDNKAIVSPSTAKLKCPLRKGGGHEGDNYIEYGRDS
jgi:hypothetical protein